jgi:ubiquinone/menaquinone biosynthesis C-methylase UbiE
MDGSHAAVVREQFRRQAPAFESEGSAFSDPALLEWALRHVELAPRFEVLDVAGGAGHLARALAPRVRRVVVVDLTPELLALGRRCAGEAVIANVTFEEGDATALSHADEAFDLVACRFALHHFPDPHAALSEMVRVCRPSGQLLIVDLVAGDSRLADAQNRLERLRDPSHTAALTSSQLASALAAAGARVVHRDARDRSCDAERWLAQPGVPPADADVVRVALRAELRGGPATGLRPSVQEGRLRITQRLEALVAQASG